MDAPTMIRPPAFDPEASAPTAPPAPAPATHAVCDECAAPVALEQRYCVNCGAHRLNVEDPAARYLGLASAHARRAIAPAHGVVAPARSRALGIGTALVLAAVPIAAGLGVLAGGSSGRGDAALVRALAHQSAADGSLLQALGNGASAAGAATTTAAAAPSKHTTAKGHRKGHTATPATTAAGPAINTSKPTPAQVKSGANVVQKIQKSSGKGYVNSQSGLPGTIVVP